MRRVISAVLMLLLLGGCVKTVDSGFPASVTQGTTNFPVNSADESTEKETVLKTTANVTSTKRATTTKQDAAELSTAAKPTQKKETTKAAVTSKKITTTAVPATALPWAQSDYAIIIGMRSVHFGCSEQDIIDIFGNPNETVIEKGASGEKFESLVYADDYGEFAVFQLCNGSFGGFYTVARSTIITDGESTYSLRSGGSTEVGDISIEPFRDSFSGGRSYALWAKIEGFSYLPEKFADVSGQERLIFHATNSLRAVNGVSALEYSEAAADCARLHCEDMISRGYFDHDTPEGITPAQRMKQSGIAYSSCGENIASGYDSPFHFADAWYNSSGHRKNILDSSYKYLGVGAVSAGGVSIYAGQNFYG